MVAVVITASVVILITISPMLMISMSHANTTQIHRLSNTSTTSWIQTGKGLGAMNNTKCISTLVCDKKIIYFVDPHVKPKSILYDYSYDGIDKDGNTITSINNQMYYQMTLGYTIHDLKRGTLVSFQNVTFAFPEGIMITPGGDLMMLDIQFPDGSQEIYGENVLNHDGSRNLGGILIPTPYGPHYATNSVTVLGNHMMPQAGLTIYHDTIKLLVSK